MGSLSRSSVYLGITVVFLLNICGPARGADSSGDINCLAGIVPCQSYLNFTGKPPSSCCSPLLTAYQTQKACLCGLLNDTSLINQFHVNITQALELPVKCGINTTVGSCTTLGGSSNQPPSSVSSGSPPPPSANESALSKASSFEKLSLLALLLLGVAAQLYQ